MKSDLSGATAAFELDGAAIEAARRSRRMVSMRSAPRLPIGWRIACGRVPFTVGIGAIGRHEDGDGGVAQARTLSNNG